MIIFARLTDDRHCSDWFATEVSQGTVDDRRDIAGGINTSYHSERDPLDFTART